MPDDRDLAFGRLNAERNGGSLKVSHDIDEAYGAPMWSTPKAGVRAGIFGRWEQEKPIRDANRHFIVDESRMSLTDDGLFSHSPVAAPEHQGLRRGDGVICCIAIDEAEGRLHVQKAVMASLIG